MPSRIQLEQKAREKKAIQDMIDSCDEKTVLEIKKQAMKELLEICDEKIKNFLAEDISPYLSGLNLPSLTLKMLKTEKMMYVSVMNTNSKREIFDLLMTRYDETFEEIMSLVKDEVTNGRVREGFYLKFCDGALERRTYMKTLCDYAKSSINI